MLRFLAKCTVFTVLLVACLASAAIKRNETFTRRGYLGAFLDKQARLADTSAPRIILVGGSNLAFGLRTDQVSEECDRKTINLGVHAGLGLKFMLDSVSAKIRADDWVIVSPEYELFTTPGFYGGRELVALMLDVDPSYLHTISIEQGCAVSPDLLVYTARDVLAQLQGGSFPRHDAGAVYSRASFNEFGDVRAHWGMRPKAIPPASEAQLKKINYQSIEYLKMFKNKVEKVGARFLLLPPAFMSSHYENHTAFIEKLEFTLDANSIPFATSCQRYRFEDALFFDTGYHLNEKGAYERTVLLCKDVERLNADYSLRTDQ